MPKTTKRHNEDNDNISGTPEEGLLAVGAAVGGLEGWFEFGVEIGEVTGIEEGEEVGLDEGEVGIEEGEEEGVEVGEEGAIAKGAVSCGVGSKTSIQPNIDV